MSYTPQKWTVSALSVEFGIDRRTLGKALEDVVPVRTAGRIKYYRLRDVYRALINHTDKAGSPQAEKARLDRLRADQVEFDLAVKRNEFAPIEYLEYAIADFSRQANSIFAGIPKKVKNSLPSLRAREIKILEKEIITAKNAAAGIQANFDKYTGAK